MRIRKTINRIHLWLGMVTGVFIVVISISGALLAFQDELKPLIYAGKYFIPASLNDTARPLSELLISARHGFGEDKPITAIELNNNRYRSVRFLAYKENADPGIWYWDEKAYYESVFVNPYTNEVIAWENSEFEFFRMMLYLHWSFLLTSSLGQPIVGVVTAVFVVSLVSGIILWRPKNKNARRSRMTFQWKKHTGIKRKVYDIHSIPGFYILIFALIFSLTGLSWAFPGFGNALEWLANGGKEPAMSQQLISTPINTEERAVIDIVVDHLMRHQASARSYYIYLPRHPKGTINVVSVSGMNSFTRITTQYDQYSGKLLKLSKFDDENNGEKLKSLNYDLHVGRIAGLTTKIIAFMVALVCASLPVTGFMIWYNRSKKKRSHQPPDELR